MPLIFNLYRRKSTVAETYRRTKSIENYNEKSDYHKKSIQSKARTRKTYHFLSFCFITDLHVELKKVELFVGALLFVSDDGNSVTINGRSIIGRLGRKEILFLEANDGRSGQLFFGVFSTR